MIYTCRSPILPLGYGNCEPWCGKSPVREATSSFTSVTTACLRLRRISHHTPAEIHDADPEPVEEAVVRHAGAARPVLHVDIADLESFAPEQRREEAVQPVEIGHHQECIAQKRFQAAAGVAGAVAQDRAAHAVGDARLQLLERVSLRPTRWPATRPMRPRPLRSPRSAPAGTPDRSARRRPASRRSFRARRARPSARRPIGRRIARA